MIGRAEQLFEWIWQPVLDDEIDCRVDFKILPRKYVVPGKSLTVKEVTNLLAHLKNES